MRMWTWFRAGRDEDEDLPEEGRSMGGRGDDAGSVAAREHDGALLYVVVGQNRGRSNIKQKKKSRRLLLVRW